MMHLFKLMFGRLLCLRECLDSTEVDGTFPEWAGLSSEQVDCSSTGVKSMTKLNIHSIYIAV